MPAPRLTPVRGIWLCIEVLDEHDTALIRLGRGYTARIKTTEEDTGCPQARGLVRLQGPWLRANDGGAARPNRMCQGALHRT